MDIEEYSPKSTLVVPQNLVKRAKYPFIDVHNHQFDMPIKDLSKLVIEMDSLNMAFMINLSGFRGLYLRKSLENIRENAPTRFGLFLNVDFETIDDTDFAEKQVALIDSAVAACVAAAAVGPENVTAIAMPSRHSSQHSIDDAHYTAKALGLNFSIREIDDLHKAVESSIGDILVAGNPVAI